MKIMAVDYGAARTGLAVCDRTEFLASPVGTIHEREAAKVIAHVANAVSEYDVKEVVIGLPRNMDGSDGERAQLSRTFAENLQKLVNIPVHLWDERQTTMQATQYLNATNVRGKKRKDVIDEVAATIILESYLSFRRNQQNRETTSL